MQEGDGMKKIESEAFREAFPRGSYCQVKVNNVTNTLNPMAFNKPGNIDGVIVAAGAKRSRIDVGEKVIQKRNQFVRAR